MNPSDEQAAAGAAPPEKVPVVENKPAADSVQIRYLQAYNFLFENPEWTTTMLWGSLAFLSSMVIPIIGQLVFMGYQFEVVELLHRFPKRTYPTFQINRFTDYLTRGLWPFLASLVMSLVFVPVMLLLFGGLLLGVFALSQTVDESVAGVVLTIGISLFVLSNIAVSLVLNIFMLPIFLRAGLAQDFNKAFDFGWMMDFARRVWVEELLVGLFMSVTALILVFAGMLCCYIGMFPVLAWLFMAQGHFYFQLYELFLSRGGEPIPLKELPAPGPIQADVV